MKKLSKRNQDLILTGVNMCGLCEDAYFYIEENLLINQSQIIQKFILWLEKNIGGVGSANIETLYNGFINPNCHILQEKVKEIKKRIEYINNL